MAQIFSTLSYLILLLHAYGHS